MAYAERIRKEIAEYGIPGEDVDNIAAAFEAVDIDQNGYIDKDEVGNLLEMVRKPTPMYKIRTMISTLDLNKDGVLNPSEFAELYKKVTENELARTFKKAITTKSGIITKGGTSTSAEGTQHSYSDEECMAFTNFIKKHLKDDPDCGSIVATMESDNLFKKLGDGVALCKLINHSAPDTIDERTINKKNLNVYRVQENLNLALNSASSIGCNIINIGGQDIAEGKPHLILGLVWQVIRIGLFKNIDLMKTPDLAALLEDGESMDDLMALSPEDLLLRWMNYHLKNSPEYQKVSNGKEIKNFSSDIKDSYAYCYLLEQIQPVDEDTKEYVLDPRVRGDDDAKATTDLARAGNVLQTADRMNVREFVTEKDIVKGNSKLNMAFVANLFNTYPALKKVEIEEPLIEETREIKTFRNWMNSLGVSPRVRYLARDVHDGLILLQLLEHLEKDVVDYKSVNTPPYKLNTAYFKKTENCNYALVLAKKLGIKVVGIGGSDLVEQNQNNILAIVWQIMRAYTLNVLTECSDDGKVATDTTIINWVNETLAQNGKNDSCIQSFKDSKISTSVCVLDLIDCIKPGLINYDYVKEADCEESKLSNAKYAISMARKLGTRIYALPEDLVEVKSKMVLTVFACLMACGLKSI